MAIEKGDRVSIRSRGLAEIALHGVSRPGTVQKILPGDEYAEVVLDEPNDTSFWTGAVMVPLNRLEKRHGD